MKEKVYGNNRIFCKGRFISGPDVFSSVASLLMIIVPSLLWHIEVGIFCADRYGMHFPLFGAFIQVLTVTMLLLTAFSDPGIVPRQKNFTDQYDSRTKTYRNRQPPKYFDILVRGHPFKMKYCTTCYIYRPPRCIHCSVCENCIERFDHHCPWVGNCIGKRNYWLFYIFIMSTAVLNVFTLLTSVSQLVVHSQEIIASRLLGSGDALVSAMGEAPLAAALALYTGLIVWFPVGLCVYHNYLIITNQTTYEQIKGAYGSGHNPFNRGIIGNYSSILMSRIRPRYFNAADGSLMWPTPGTSEDATDGDTRNVRAVEPAQPTPPPAGPATTAADESVQDVRRVSEESVPACTVTEAVPPGGAEQDESSVRDTRNGDLPVQGAGPQPGPQRRQKL